MWSGGETGKLKIKQFELMTFDDLTVNEEKKKNIQKAVICVTASSQALHLLSSKDY